MASPHLYFDGDYRVASPSSAIETETPFPFQPTVQIFRQKFQQFRTNFTPLAIGTLMNNAPTGIPPITAGSTGLLLSPAPSTNKRGPFLVEEGPRVSVGAGDVVEWTRVYAHLPFDIYEFPSLNYSRQNYAVETVPWFGIVDRWGNFQGTYRTFTALEEWPQPTTAIVHRRFIRAPDTWAPEKILAACDPQVPFRIVKITDQRGQEQVFSFGVHGVAEPTTITRWMGDIREIRDVYVEVPSIATAGASGMPTNGTFSNLPPSGFFNDGF